MRYVRVESVTDLLDASREEGAVLVAGGTDLVVKMRAGLVAPRVLVDISNVEALRGVFAIDGAVEIGAVTPEEDLLASATIRDRLPLLARVLSVLGSVQIRNRGTLGGNLVNASPAADSAVPLLCYDADVVLTGAHGERVLPIASFLLGPGRTALEPGEFVRAIRVPIPERSVSFFHKVGKRRALTIAIASVGAVLRLDGLQIREARIAAGSVAPVPLRLDAVERLLIDAEPTDALIDEARRTASAAVAPISDVRASADYRRSVVGDLVARALLEAQSAAAVTARS